MFFFFFKAQTIVIIKSPVCLFKLSMQFLLSMEMEYVNGEGNSFLADNIIYYYGLICTLLQISYDSFQDTVDKPMDSDSEVPDMFEYLTVNSSGPNTKGKISNQ